MGIFAQIRAIGASIPDTISNIFRKELDNLAYDVLQINDKGISISEVVRLLGQDQSFQYIPFPSSDIINMLNGRRQAIAVVTTGSAKNVTLPLSSDLENGDTFLIFDDSDNADNFNITILRNGNTIGNSATNRVISSPNGYLWIYFSNGDFKIIADYSTNTTLSRIGTSTYSTNQHLMNFSLSSGVFAFDGITDTGGCNITVGEGNGVIRANDTDGAILSFFNWEEETSISIPNNTTRYVGIEYNAGTPVIIIKTTDDWDLDTEFPLGFVVNESENIYIGEFPWTTGDTLTNLIERLDAISLIQRDDRYGGMIITNTGTRNIAITASQLIARVSEFPIAAFDSSGAGLFDGYYQDGAGSATKQGNITQWDNTKWDNATGTLANLTAGYFTSRWFYQMVDSSVAMVYGDAEYSTGALALNDPLPSFVPQRIQKLGILIGRIIAKQGTNTPEYVQSAFGVAFTDASVTSHTQLTDKGIKTHPEIDTFLGVLTTKGDLLSVASSVATRLPVGLTGQKLESNSSPTIGLSWKDKPYDTSGLPLTDNIGYHASKYLSTNGTAYLSLQIPNDFNSWNGIYLIIVPIATDANANIDLSTQHTVGGVYNQYSESSTTATYNLTMNNVFGLDISSVLTLATAGSMVGLRIVNNTVISGYHILGIKGSYR